MKKLIIFFAICSLQNVLFYANAQYYLHSNWKLCKSTIVNDTGINISKPGYPINNWMDAVVPGTVLTSLIKNSVFSDPYFDYNFLNIPDISTAGRDYYTYWYRLPFLVPDTMKGKTIWLNLRGINYTAEIYLNGNVVSPGYKGMFLRRAFDITDFVTNSDTNYLAIKIYPPDHPGIPSLAIMGKDAGSFSNGGNGEIGRDVTMQYTLGWDWTRPIPDRNTGIWDKIYLISTSSISISDAQVITDLKLPDTTKANIFINVWLKNNSEKQVTGKLYATINGKTGSFTISKDTSIDSAQSIKVSLTPAEFGSLSISNPALWWPNGYGNQNLYNLNVNFKIGDTLISDSSVVNFGVRKFQFSYNPEIVVSVNGKKVLCKGGNWVCTDALLRFSNDRYDKELYMHKQANLTMIRVWGGGITERPEFYDYCDKYGILVMQDFWITGDCNGRWHDPQGRAYPDDHSLFVKSVVDNVKMLRNHASLCIWVGGNEQTMPDDIQTIVVDSIMPLMDTTHVFIPTSATNGIHGGGPYGYTNESDYFNYIAGGFTTEVGTYAFAPYESLSTMFTTDHLLWPFDETDGDAWQYHFAIYPNTGYTTYENRINSYGSSNDLKEFSYKAQIVNYNAYRAIFEAWNQQLWNTGSGVLLWKSQDCWPSLIWQLYDWYLLQNGGYFGSQRACESIHIQMNPSNKIYLVNNTQSKLTNLTVKYNVYNLKGKLTNLTDSVTKFSIGANTSLGVKTLKFASDSNYIVRLILSRLNKTISENYYYWGNLTMLNALTKNSPDINIISKDTLGDRFLVNADIKNDSAVPIAYVRLKLIDKTTNQLILPAYYSDNYFFVMPGETKHVTVEAYLNNINNDVDLIAETFNQYSQPDLVPNYLNTVNSISSIIVYPNPFNDYLKIKCSSPISNGQVQLFDLRGVKVAEQLIVNESEINLNTAKLISAPYFYVVRNNSLVVGSGIVIKQ